VGVEIALWTVGLWIMSGNSGFRSIINGPFVAVVVALILNYTGLYHWIPEILVVTMEMLGRCAVPMAVLMIGSTIGRFATRGILHDTLRVGASSVLARLVLGAMIILCAAKFLPISADLKRLLIIQAAMPAAIFPIALARLYGGQPQIAIQVVIVTSLVGIVSIPFVIAWGLGWVNP
jgi:predicted permease